MHVPAHHWQLSGEKIHPNDIVKSNTIFLTLPGILNLLGLLIFSSSSYLFLTINN